MAHAQRRLSARRQLRTQRHSRIVGHVVIASPVLFEVINTKKCMTYFLLEYSIFVVVCIHNLNTRLIAEQDNNTLYLLNLSNFCPILFTFT